MSLRANPAAFRERILSKLAGHAPTQPAHDTATALGRKRNRNTARNAQRRKSITPWAWKRKLKEFENKCAYCGETKEQLEREHFLPLLLGGTLAVANVVPSCLSCNRKKRDTHPLLWLMERYGYFTGLGMWARIENILAVAK